MAIPLSKYVEVKDNYCLSYFGNDVDFLNDILKARDTIEQELKGLKVFIACDTTMKKIVYGRRNIILKSKLADFSGKMACSRNLEEKQDLKSLLEEAKIKVDE